MSDPIGHPIDDVDYARGYPQLTGDARDGTDAVGPTTPWEYEQAARTHNEQQAAAANALAEQRNAAIASELAAARLSNGDPTNAPHFLRVSANGDACGQCGEPFPCPAFLAGTPAASPVVADRVYDDFAPSVSGELLAGVTPEQLRAAAAELGVSPDRLTGALNRYIPND